MKENSLSGEDGKNPKPLPTPQPATKMEEELEEIRKRSDDPNMGMDGKDLGRLFEIVEDLRKERDKIYDLQKGKFPESENEEWFVSLSKDARSFIWAFWEGAASWEEEAKNAKKDLATAQAQLRRKDEALRSLVERLDMIHADEKYKSVWMISQIHVGPYTGPNLIIELADARAALADGKEGGR